MRQSKDLFSLIKSFFKGTVKTTKKILLIPVKIVVSILSVTTFVFIMTGLALFILFGFDQEEGDVECLIKS